MLPSCPFSTYVTPGISRRTHPEREPCIYIKCVFLAFRHFFLFRPRVFSRTLGSVARREPARTPHASLGPGRGPWYVLWVLKVAVPSGRHSGHVEPSRPLQTHVQVKRMSDGYNVISGILNIINVVRKYLLDDGKVFPRHQHA